MKFQELSAEAIRGIDRENTLVVIPIAAVEQHGPHMPTGTDTILCSSIADALENRLPSQILQTPTLWVGASAHHLRFGATLDCSLDTYVASLCDIARSLLDDGFRRILFLNGHGGNIDPMKMAVRELQISYVDALLAAGCYWSAADAAREKILEGEHKFVGHACEFETSLMLHVRPDLVDESNLQNAGKLIDDTIDGFYISRDMKQRTAQGYTGRPDLATAEKGEKLFAETIKGLESLVHQLLEQPLGETYDDFA